MWRLKSARYRLTLRNSFKWDNIIFKTLTGPSSDGHQRKSRFVLGEGFMVFEGDFFCWKEHSGIFVIY